MTTDLSDKVIQLLIYGYCRAKQRECNLSTEITHYSSIHKIITAFYSSTYSLGTRVLPFEDQFEESTSDIDKNQMANQMDNNPDDQKVTEVIEPVIVVIGAEKETFPKKLLSYKLDYFKAMLSNKWNKGKSADGIPGMIVEFFEITEKPIFDLAAFKLLLLNINDNHEFNIPATLEPDQLLSLVECANFFAVLNNDHILQCYYEHCTKLITNQQLQQWVNTKIPRLSTFASERLKYRKSEAFEIISTRLGQICLLCVRPCVLGRPEYSVCNFDYIKMEQLQYVLSLVERCVDFHSGNYLEQIISQLHKFATRLIQDKCQRSEQSRKNFVDELLKWLLDIGNDAIHEHYYRKCVLFLMTTKISNNRYQMNFHWYENWLIVWGKIVICLMQEKHPNVMKEVVIPTWALIFKQTQVVEEIFNIANNQQGHMLALHILKSNIDGSGNNTAPKYEDFCSKFCY